MPEQKKIIDGQQVTLFTGDSYREFASSFINPAAGLGNGRDKTSYGQFGQGEDFSRNRQAADDLYRFQWMAKIIDIPAYDMTREWRTWSSSKLDPQKIKGIEDAEKAFNYQFKIQESLTWAGTYGGCAIILSVDGHGDASTPLDVTKIQKGQLKRLLVIDRHRIFPYPTVDVYNPFSETEGEPEVYNVLGSQQLIHTTRIVKFIGLKLPWWERQKQLWWGDSKFNRLYDTIRNNKTVIQSIATLIHETNIDVLTVDGLANKIAGDGSEDVKEYFSFMGLMKAINGMMLLDGDTQKYDRKGASFQSLPQVLLQFLNLLSAASDIPVTRLLGQSPGGLNATGESDIRNYYDMVSSHQVTDLQPQMEYIDQAMVRSLLGDYPEDLSWDYDSLWQMTPKEESDIANTDSNTLLNLQDLGVPTEAILKDVQEKGLSSNLDDDMIEKAMAELDEEIPEDEETKLMLENKDPDDDDNKDEELEEE